MRTLRSLVAALFILMSVLQVQAGFGGSDTMWGAGTSTITRTMHSTSRWHLVTVQPSSADVQVKFYDDAGSWTWIVPAGQTLNRLVYAYRYDVLRATTTNGLDHFGEVL